MSFERNEELIMKKKLRTLILAFILQIFSGQQVMAANSCVGSVDLLNSLVASITSLGLFAVYSANFQMVDAPDGTKCNANYYGGVMHNPKGCAPGATNCSSNCDPKGGVEICYKALVYNGSSLSNPTGLEYDYSCQEVQDGWRQVYPFPPATLRAKKVGDKLCVQFWTILGFQNIGCKYLPDCSQFSLSPSCYVAQSCSNSAFQNSRSFIPISGSIVQCIKESIQRLFTNYTGCGDSTNYKQNYFPVFQNTMRNVVRALLILYLIFFGIKAALGGEVPSRGEFFQLGAKFLLVIYFSVGFSNGYNGNGQAQYDDGVTTIMLPFFQDASTTLANIVYSAGGSTGLCVYNTKDYAKGYEYLALWDSIDCRLLYYLGIDQEKIATTALGGAAITMFMMGASTMFMLVVAALFGLQIIFAVFCIVFMVFLLSVVIYFVNITIISMIALAILIYMAPIFVPMALFGVTKKYFDAWIKLVISYALQPMIIAAYIAMMLTIFDQTMFGNCTFVSSDITWSYQSDGTTGGAPTKMKPFFQICDPDNPQTGCSTSVTDVNATNCKDTFGYKITNQQNNLVSGGMQTLSAIFFTYTALSPGEAADLLVSLITLCLFAYLFYKFADMLGGFAAELTGGTNLGSLAGRPMELFDKVMSAVTKGRGGGAPAAPEAPGSEAEVSSTARPGAGAPGAGAGAPGGGAGAAAAVAAVPK